MDWMGKDPRIAPMQDMDEECDYDGGEWRGGDVRIASWAFSLT